MTLNQRKLVQKEIAKEYRAWKKKLRREPSEAERQQIIAIGFSQARAKNRRIPEAANLFGLTPRALPENPLSRGERKELYGRQDDSMKWAEKFRRRGLDEASGFHTGRADAYGQVAKDFAGYEEALSADRREQDRIAGLNPRPAVMGESVSAGDVCAVCGKSFPASWPWLSDAGRKICSSACFGQANPLTPAESSHVRQRERGEFASSMGSRRETEAAYHRGAASAFGEVHEKYGKFLNNPGVVTLHTQAKDNHGHEYPVELRFGNVPGSIELRVVNTPGSWYLKTLLERGEIHETIAIDVGQNWVVENFGDVMREAIETMRPKYDWSDEPGRRGRFYTNPHLEGDPCSQCGGELNFMGQLGNLEHYRCRNCGMEFSTEAPQENPLSGKEILSLLGDAEGGMDFIEQKVAVNDFDFVNCREEVGNVRGTILTIWRMRGRLGPSANRRFTALVGRFNKLRTHGVELESGREYSITPPFRHEQENPTGLPFTGQRYYRPAKRIGKKVIRKRIPLVSGMKRRGGAHKVDYTTYRPNPLLMTVMGNPLSKDDPESEVPVEEGFSPFQPWSTVYSERTRERSGVRQALKAPPVPTYAGQDLPDDGPKISKLRSIARTGMMAEYEGSMLDPESASVIAQVYDSIPIKIKARFAKQSLPVMGKLIHEWLRQKSVSRWVVSYYPQDSATLKVVGGFGSKSDAERWAASSLPGVAVEVYKRNPGACPPICNKCHGKYRANPGKSRTVTMSLKKFAQMLQEKGDPEQIEAFRQKIEGYKAWTHGSLPSKVTMEQVDAPGMQGIWITYDMGREPEKTYIMPGKSKRKGAWKHPWESMPHLKGDPEAGIIITKTVKGNKITDFLHG